MSNVGDRIRLLMHFKKLNATQLAEIINVQRSSISHILTGRNKPSLDLVQRVVNEFPEVSYDWLLNGTGKLNRANPNNQPTLSSNSDSNGIDNDTNVPQQETKTDTSVSDEHSRDATDVSKDTAEKKNGATSKQVTEVNTNINKTLPKVTKVIIFYDDGSYQEIQQQ